VGQDTASSIVHNLVVAYGYRMTETGLERQVCFSLYATSRALTGLYRPVLAELGLTYPQYVAMLALWQRGPLGVRELGAALELDSGTLSPLLRRLEAQGLVRRERGVEDERTVQISLTPAGSALRARVADLPQRIACAVDLSPDELDQLRRLLDRVRAAASTHTF
jgi:DNA-binding MarR family transcriptional regulator